MIRISKKTDPLQWTNKPGMTDLYLRAMYPKTKPAKKEYGTSRGGFPICIRLYGTD